MSASYSSIPPVAALAAGAKVAGRFSIQRALPLGSFGQTYEVQDDRSGKRAALRLIQAGLVRDKEDAERVRAEVKLAAGLVHRNIVGTYGIGQEPNGDMFLTMEYVDGQHLRALLERRAQASKKFSLRGAFNVVAHVCHALTHAQGKGAAHGSLSPYHVFVSRTGRVKVAGFALSRILPTLRGLSPDLRTYLLTYLAPEARGGKGAKLDSRADVFSVAVMLFELLGGKPRPGIVPSAASLGQAVPEGVRKVLETALAHNPAQRPASAEAFEGLLSAELQRLGEIEPADDDLRLDVELDLGAGPAEAAAAPAAPAATAAVAGPGAPAVPPPRGPGASAPRLPVAPAAVDISVAPASSGGPAGAMLRAAAAASRSAGSTPPASPARGSRIPIEDSFRAPDATPGAPGLPIVGRASSVDFGSVLSQLDADDVERWMLQKDKLDHGPFRDRELAEMILKGVALGDHMVSNLETGARCKLKQIEPFKPFLEKYKVRKKQEEEQAALKRSVKVERMGFAAKVAIALGIATAVAGAAVGLYYGLRGTGGEKQAASEDQKVASGGPTEVTGVQAKLTEASLETQAPPAKDPTKKKRGGGRRSGSGGSGRPGSGMESWDSAWNAGGNLDLDSSDSAPILTGRDITAAMRSKQGALFSCVRGEMGRNPGMPSQVNIEMLIRGHEVVAARTPGQSGAFENCIQGVLSSVRFEKQAYGQMRSTFSMEVVR
jgi:hypothetical protein